MKPGAPTVVGPITSCSRSVRLQGLLAGAKVSLLVSGRPIDLGAADWPDQVFAFPAGLALPAGDSVRTQQSLGSDIGDPSLVEVLVAGVATPLPPPWVLSPVIGCASLVTVDGVTPDSTITVRDGSGAVLGSSPASGTFAAVHLSRTLGMGETVQVVTDACGSVSVADSLGAERMAPPGDTLDAPVFSGGVVYECQRVLAFEGLRPGETIILTRGDGSEITFECNRDVLRGRLDPPVKPGEQLSARVEASRVCEVHASPDTRLTATTGPPPAPRVVAPPCPASPAVSISGLVASARVRLSRAGTDLVEFDAAESTGTFDLAGANLTNGDIIDVTQELCGLRSAPCSVRVEVRPATASLELVRPMVQCARSVRVLGVPSGSWVSIRSDQLRGEIGRGISSGEGAIDIEVVPSLILGDRITAVITGCGDGSSDGTVESATPEVPLLERAVVGETAVDVSHLIVGSVVDVIATPGNETLASVIASERETRVGLRRPLRSRESIKLTVRWCAHTLSGDGVPVTERTPLVLASLSPMGLKNNGGSWNSGRIEAIAPLAGGEAIVGGEWSGLWYCRPGNPPQALSWNWPEARILCVSADPTKAGRWFAGTPTGLYATDPDVIPPHLAWAWIPAAPTAVINDVLVLPAHGLVILATGSGLFQAPLAGFPAVAFTPADPLVQTGDFRSLALGPNDSVVAYRGRNQITDPAGRVFVGRGAGGLTWTDQTFATPPGGDSRLSAIAVLMGNGALSSCAADRSRVYLGVEDKSDGTWLPVLRSDDGGLTWMVPNTDSIATHKATGLGPALGSQAERNLAVAAHPSDRDKVVLGARRSGLLGSNDAAATWDVAGWPATGDEFHGDTLCVTFDPSDPDHSTLWAGGDGGVYVSTDGGDTWNSEHNHQMATLMFDTWGLNTGWSMSANPADPAVIVGGLQDNGLVYLPGAGKEWVQVIGGDGIRAKFVADDAAMLVVNDGLGIRWVHWDGSEPKHRNIVNPPGAVVGTSNPTMARVVAPSYRRNGHLMVAVASDNDAPGALYGLFDEKPGTDDPVRFSWQILATLAGTISGLASWDGHQIVASFTTPAAPPAPAQVRHVRVDSSSGIVNPMSSTQLAGRSGLRFPTFLTPSTVIALDDQGVVLTSDLITWRPVGKPTSTSSTPWAIDADVSVSPPTIFAGTQDGLYASYDSTATWIKAGGLPATPVACQVEVVRAPGRRVLTVGTWNWSVFASDLQ